MVSETICSVRVSPSPKRKKSMRLELLLTTLIFCAGLFVGILLTGAVLNSKYKQMYSDLESEYHALVDRRAAFTEAYRLVEEINR